MTTTTEETPLRLRPVNALDSLFAMSPLPSDMYAASLGLPAVGATSGTGALDSLFAGSYEGAAVLGPQNGSESSERSSLAVDAADADDPDWTPSDADTLPDQIEADPYDDDEDIEDVGEFDPAMEQLMREFELRAESGLRSSLNEFELNELQVKYSKGLADAYEQQQRMLADMSVAEGDRREDPDVRRAVDASRARENREALQRGRDRVSVEQRERALRQGREARAREDAERLYNQKQQAELKVAAEMAQAAVPVYNTPQPVADVVVAELNTPGVSNSEPRAVNIPVALTPDQVEARRIGEQVDGKAVRARLEFMGEGVHIRAFPKELVQRLRELLIDAYAVHISPAQLRSAAAEEARHLGKSPGDIDPTYLRVRLAKARVDSVSQDRLVIGYVIAMTDSQIKELDEVTREIVVMFRAANPILNKLDAVADMLSKQATVMTRVHEATRTGRHTLDTLETGMGFMVATAIAAVDTQTATPSTVNTTQAAAVTARNRLRQQSRKLVEDERLAEGRRKYANGVIRGESHSD